MYSFKRLVVFSLFIYFYSISLVARAQNQSTTARTEAPDENTSLKRLRQELLITRQYDRISRPVKNHLTQVKVDMRITVNEFVDLDTVNSMLVTDAWFHITWRDELLTWNPNDYSQLTQIHMHPNEIWRPDIVLINTAEQDEVLNVFTESEILLNNTGEITWITMGILKSKCPVWAYDYPFTIRPITCRITFCSLIYQSHEVNITTPGDEFFLAGPWSVNPRLQFINASGERFERAYSGYGTYSFESLIVKLKRRDNSLPLIMRIPTLTSILIVLCMFFMPVTWSVRLHLAMLAIFIQLLLILYVGLQLGPNAIGLARPILFLRADLFLSCMALIGTLAFRRLLALADSLPDLPYLVSSLLAGPIARLLCFGINQHEYQASGLAVPGKAPPNILPTSLHGPRATAAGAGHLGDRVSLINEEPDELEARLASGGSRAQGVPDELLVKTVHVSISHFEWMQLIVFCDRLMFILFALIMIPRLI